MATIEVPGVGSMEFPDDMPKAQMEGHIKNYLVSQRGAGRLENMVVPPESRGPGGAIVHAINALPEAVGQAAGHAVQSFTEPYLGGTGSDIAGALTSEGLQFLGPQALSTGARLAAKGLATIAPGTKITRMEHAIEGARGKLAGGLSNAQVNQRELTGLAEKIPSSSAARLDNTMKTVDDIIASNAAHGITDSPVVADAKRLKDLIEKSGAKDIRWIDTELTNIGEKTKSVQGVKADPAYKRIFGSMAQDLEQPSGYAGKTNLAYLQDPQLAAKGELGHGQLVREKDQATRRVKGLEDVGQQFESMVHTKRGPQGAQDINAASLGDRLRQDEFLQKSLRPSDWAEVNPLIDKIAKLQPPTKSVTGSIMRGVAAPLTAGISLGVEYGLNKALSTKGGRNMINAILDAKTIEPSQKLNYLNAFVRTMTGETGGK